MDARQQQYLKAMGVTAWVRRDLQQNNGAEVIPVPTVAAVAAPVVESQPASPVVSAPPVVKPVTPAGDWDGLVQQVDDCQQCGLYKTRLNAVFGVGHRQAEWMIIGDAPGADDDKRKEPFVGEAGLLLNAMLQAVGLKRESVYISNSLKCRPPNNRTPKPEELAACVGYLQAQIGLLQPKLIIALGTITAQLLLHSDEDIGGLRGRIHHYGEQQIPLIVTQHPTHLLRFPADKRSSWEDLQLAMSVCPPGSQA